VKHFTPDHPDFAAIAATITPLNKIKSQAFPRTAIWEERSENQNTKKTRHESVDKL